MGTDYLGKEEREWWYHEMITYVEAMFGEDEKDAKTFDYLWNVFQRFRENKATVKDYQTVLYQITNKFKENCCSKCNEPWFDE